MEGKEDYRLASIMFTDINGFSKMMEQNEKKTIELLKKHNVIIEQCVKKYKGNIIKTIGDAFLVDFNNTVNSVKCAIEIQEEMKKMNEGFTDADKMVLRIGVHLGDIYFYENDALGEGINIASRLQSLSKPGRICISKDVYNQILNKIDIEMISLGQAKLKNISKEIFAYEIITDVNDKEKINIIEKEKLEEIQSKYNKTINEETGREKKVYYNTEEELNDDIVDKIKTNDRRVSYDKIHEYFPIGETKLNKVLEKLTDKGVLTKIVKENGMIEYSPGRLMNFMENMKRTGNVERNFNNFQNTDNDINNTNNSTPDVKRQIKRLIENNKKSYNSLFPDLTSYLGTMICLSVINLLTSASYPWVFYPAFGWGIGLLAHYVNAFLAKDFNKYLVNLPENTTPEQLKLFNEYNNQKKGWFSHLSSYLSVNAFLFFIMLVNSVHFPFPLIVMASWGIGLFSHYFAYTAKKSRLKEKLAELGFVFSKNKEISAVAKDKSTQNKLNKNEAVKPEISSEYKIILDKAYKIKSEIITQISKSEHLKNRVDTDIGQMLDKYIEQIKQLIQRDEELSQLIETISIEDINTDLERLQGKHLNCTNEELKHDYEKSIEQLRKHKISYEELGNQKEMVYLQISKAMTSLKQLQMDLTNMKEVLSKENDYMFKIFEERSNELTNYTRNIKKSYSELKRELD